MQKLALCCCSAQLEEWEQCWEQQHSTPTPDSKFCESDGDETQFSTSVSCSLQSNDSDSDTDDEDEEVNPPPIPHARPTFVPKLILNQNISGKGGNHHTRIKRLLCSVVQVWPRQRGGNLVVSVSDMFCYVFECLT